MIRVLTLAFLLSLLTACGTEKVVEKPVPVRVEVVKWTPVPKDLTRQLPKQAIPDTLTYGQAIELWSRDRGSLDIVNARLRGIQELSSEDTVISEP